MTAGGYVLFYGNRQGVQMLPDRMSDVKQIGAVGNLHPFALVVIDGKDYGPEHEARQHVEKYYVEKDVPGISGGNRKIIILMPRTSTTP